MLVVNQSTTVVAGLLLGLVSLTFAQSISTQCQSGLTGSLLNPGAACLNPQGLLGILTAGSNASLAGPVNSYLAGFCSQPSCSNATLASVFGTLTTDCQAEIASLGLGSVSGPELTSLVQAMFPTFKEIACLKDTSNNTLCVTESIDSVQSADGPLTLAGLSQFLTSIASAAVPSVPNSAKCSDCSKATFNIITQTCPGVVNSTTQQNIEQTCGADFINGSNPTDVVQTANGATASNGTTSSNDSNSAIGLNAAFSRAAMPMILSAASLSVFLV